MMKPQPGEYWRDREGEVHGPLQAISEGAYTLEASDLSWMPNGSLFEDGPQSSLDLVGRVGPAASSDPVNHPDHYTSHKSGIECIQVTEHMTFNLGNVVKYVWRFDGKGGVQDLKKAAWYLQREIERLERDNETSA